MKTLLSTFAAFVIFFSVGNTFAQVAGKKLTTDHTVTLKVPSVAMVDLAGSNLNFDLEATAPQFAGEAIGVSATNSNAWLNYSSVITENNTRSVKAQLSASLPAGISLKVNAAADNGKGNGQIGTSTGVQTLSDSQAKVVVNNIGSCYTGKGSENGHQLTYTLELNHSGYATLREASHAVKVTYTISED
ncbi:MAG TPA: hypothetical protein PK167_07560 [Prolixibacteraceae bacterium]|nr:hypothetical protein [Prolixibacteraceae bacterium]